MALVARVRSSKIPTVGSQSIFEAGIISNFRFYKHAEAVLVEGYTKVHLKISSLFMTDIHLVQRTYFPVQETGCGHASPTAQIRQRHSPVALNYR